MLSHSNSELCSFSGLYFVFISASLWPNVVVFSFFLAHEEIVYKMFCQKHLSAIQCHSSGAVTPLNHIYLHINVANNLHTTTHTHKFTHTRCANINACERLKICFTREVFSVSYFTFGAGLWDTHTTHNINLQFSSCICWVLLFLLKFAHVNNNISTLRVPFGVNFRLFLHRYATVYMHPV